MGGGEKKSTSARLQESAVQALESLQRAGVTSLPRPRRRAASNPPAGRPVGGSRGGRQGERSSGRRPRRQTAAGRRRASGSRGRDALRQQASTGWPCCAARWRPASAAPSWPRRGRRPCFGVGNPDARLCFFGEAPGADEDRLGEPFVGRAGQLLDKIIEACQLRREDVYICNVLRCRPPGNRTPSAEEVANCRGHFERQLAIIQPEFVCCLGSVAAQALLDTTESIGRLRKKFFERSGMRIICTYHPAYLLRNPAAKRDVWDDMKLLMAEMGVTL